MLLLPAVGDGAQSRRKEQMRTTHKWCAYVNEEIGCESLCCPFDRPVSLVVFQVVSDLKGPDKTSEFCDFLLFFVC